MYWRKAQAPQQDRTQADARQNRVLESTVVVANFSSRSASSPEAAAIPKYRSGTAEAMRAVSFV